MSFEASIIFLQAETFELDSIVGRDLAVLSQGRIRSRMARDSLPGLVLGFERDILL